MIDIRDHGGIFVGKGGGGGGGPVTPPSSGNDFYAKTNRSRFENLSGDKAGNYYYIRGTSTSTNSKSLFKSRNGFRDSEEITKLDIADYVVDENLNIFVLGEYKLVKYNSNNQIVFELDVDTGHKVTLAEDGNIFYADKLGVYKVNSTTGDIISESPVLHSEKSSALDGSGNRYYLPHGNSSIRVIEYGSPDEVSYPITFEVRNNSVILVHQGSLFFLKTGGYCKTNLKGELEVDKNVNGMDKIFHFDQNGDICVNSSGSEGISVFISKYNANHQLVDARYSGYQLQECYFSYNGDLLQEVATSGNNIQYLTSFLPGPK